MPGKDDWEKSKKRGGKGDSNHGCVALKNAVSLTGLLIFAGDYLHSAESAGKQQIQHDGFSHISEGLT